jgi:cytoskeletal protein RodZ
MTDRQLVRKLIIVVLIKLVLLFALWWAFFRGQQVVVNGETMAQVVQPDNSISKSIRSRKRAADSVNTRQGEVDKERIDLEME